MYSKEYLEAMTDLFIEYQKTPEYQKIPLIPGYREAGRRAYRAVIEFILDEKALDEAKEAIFGEFAGASRALGFLHGYLYAKRS